MSRIQPGDTGIEVIVKMSDGKHEAFKALMNIIVQSAEIDPLDGPLAVAAILSMDTHQIYGTDICILYNDKCQQDVRKLLLLLKACQLDIMPVSKLQSLAGDQMQEIEFPDAEFIDLSAKMCEHLADFQRPPAANNSEQSSKR